MPSLSRGVRSTITAASPLEGRWLRLTFADGAVHEVDLTDLLAVGVVLPAVSDDDAVFGAVRVDEEFGTIVWPGGLDLDPDVLRGCFVPASGAELARRNVRLGPTARARAVDAKP